MDPGSNWRGEEFGWREGGREGVTEGGGGGEGTRMT